MGGIAPDRWFDLILGGQVLRPVDSAGTRVQAPHVTHGADCIDTAAAYEGRHPRTAGIGDVVVRAIVLVFPYFFPVGGIQAKDSLRPLDASFDAGERFAGSVLGSLAVHHVDETVGHGRAAVAGSQGRPPYLFWSARRKLLDETGLAPHTLATRAEPLRPIGRTGGRASQQHGHEGK